MMRCLRFVAFLVGIISALPIDGYAQQVGTCETGSAQAFLNANIVRAAGPFGYFPGLLSEAVNFRIPARCSDGDGNNYSTVTVKLSQPKSNAWSRAPWEAFQSVERTIAFRNLEWEIR